MAQFKNKSNREDKESWADGTYSTSVTPLGNGCYGARVFRNGKIIFEDNSAKNRKEAAELLKEQLRWTDKMGYMSPMASASRDRRASKWK